MSVKLPKSSHKKNRPFDFKLIDLVEPNSILYQRQSGLSTFDAMKIKNEIWKNISMEMGQSIQFCMMRWNNLRGQFQKELRRCRELCPKSGVIRGSTWAYLDRLRFLEHTIQFNKKQSESDCISIKEEDVDEDRVLDEEVEEHLQAISKLNEEDDDEEVEEEQTEVGWEYLDSENGANESTSSMEVFKQENNSIFQSQEEHPDLHHHHHHEQQQEEHQRPSTLDGSDFSIITEIIVNSDSLPQEVTISQDDENQMEHMSVIDEHHGSRIYQCPIKTQTSTLSRSPSLSHNSMSVTPTPTVVPDQQHPQLPIPQQQHLQRHHTLTQTLHHSQQLQLQLQQQQEEEQQQQQQQQQHHHQQPLHQEQHQPQPQPQYQQTPNLSATSNNFIKMRYLLDGFDEANRQRVERRILAYLCKVQLYDLYNQDVSVLNI